MNPLPPPGSRRRSNKTETDAFPLNSHVGEVVSVNTAAGTGLVCFDGSTVEFPLRILSGADLLALINGRGDKINVQFVLNEKLFESMSILDAPEAHPGACDNPSLVKDPPTFALKLFPVEPTYPEISVVLIDNSSALWSVLENLQGEKSAVGLDIVCPVHVSKCFVCICVSSLVFAIDTSALPASDVELLFTYLVDFSKLDVPIISSENDVFISSLIPLESNQKIRTISKWISHRPVLPGSTVEAAVDARLAYSMDPIVPADDSDYEALAFLLGRGCFHARQIFLLPTAGLAPPVKRARDPSPTRAPPRRTGPVPDGTLSERERQIIGEENAKKYLKWFQ